MKPDVISVAWDPMEETNAPKTVERGWVHTELDSDGQGSGEDND